ncbi:MAG: histidine phosphatase family protein [Treponema sp.]|jgi:putative nucleotidyltransferase with HDIG domain|nr:histidine phosphatase family protein [Treponema sp.]
MQTGKTLRTLYLVRHGEVDFGGVKRCIGRTDIPLSERGKYQAERLKVFFTGKGLTGLYASPARRTRLTADIISQGRWPVQLCSGLAEINMGDWEGLTFVEIKKRFPDLYTLRGQNRAIAPPNGETPAQVQIRAAAAIEQILTQSEGNVTVVTHAGVNRLLLCKYQNLAPEDWLSLPQPYGCINKLWIGEDGITVGEAGRMPVDIPDEEECFKLFRKKETPQRVVDHCQAVAYKAMEITSVFAKYGTGINGDLVYIAALLHDIAKGHRSHAQTGADWLRAEGYPKVADIIALHEDLPEPVVLDEAAVVYLADKLLMGTLEVSLEERFTYSMEKCHDETARSAHEKRFRQALRLREQILGACGTCGFLRP